MGTLDSALRIERVSGQAPTLLGRPLDVMVGESILTLIVHEDVPTFLVAYADAAASHQGVTVALHLSTSSSAGERTSHAVLCDVFVVPLRPSPGCAFVLRPVTTTAPAPADSEVVSVVSERSVQPAGTPDLAHGILRGVSVHSVAGLGRLTTRERQIVSRLLDGHRPPGIARALFLSQSTVRNHLASVFRKLGVTSQEGLLELFRMAAAREDHGSEAVGDHGRVSRIS